MWQQTTESGQSPEREPHFDRHAIEGIHRLIEEHNAAWDHWFVSVGVRPHRVLYEDLDVDPVGVTRGVLDFLGLELPPGGEIQGRQRRLADELNTQWVDRYRTETAGA